MTHCVCWKGDEINALKEIRENWTPAQDYFTDFLAYLGIDDAVAEEVALIPGLEDFFLLTRILRELESGQHDVVIVDCSPTADAAGPGEWRNCWMNWSTTSIRAGPSTTTGMGWRISSNSRPTILP